MLQLAKDIVSEIVKHLDSCSLGRLILTHSRFHGLLQETLRERRKNEENHLWTLIKLHPKKIKSLNWYEIS